MKYQFTKRDKQEIKGLLVFLRGATKNSPIKSIEFFKHKKAVEINIERWDDYKEKEFSTISLRIEK